MISAPIARPIARAIAGPLTGRAGGLVIGPVYRVAVVGDSITNATSGALYEGRGFMSNGWAAHLRNAARGTIELVANPVESSWDFGVSGSVTAGFQTGGTARATFEAALASAADTIIYALGVNDVGNGVAAATTKANMLAQWAEIQAAGKQLVIFGLFACGESHPTAGFMDAARALNTWIATQAAAIGAVFFNPAAVCDFDKDGFSDADMLADQIHPNTPGAAYLGQAAHRTLAPYLSQSNRFTYPAAAATAWKTPNPYASGTLGSNQTATNWTAAPHPGSSPSVAVAKNLIARTDITGNWQELVITGAAAGNVLITSPTDYVLAYVTASNLAIAEGDQYFAACEIEPVGDSTFYGCRLMLTNESAGTGTRRYDMDPNGNLASGDAGVYTPLLRSDLRTPNLAFASAVTNTLRCWLTIYGNGTLRIGRFGIIKA